MSVSKHYLLDTSVILDDTNNIQRLYDEGQNVIYITDIVLAELNNRKEDIRSEAGYRAREFFRLVDNEEGSALDRDTVAFLPELKSEVNTAQDRYYQLSVIFSEGEASKQAYRVIPLYVIYREVYRIDKSFHQAYGLNDAKIAEIAYDYGLTLVTNDIALKISAQVQNIQAQSLKNSQVTDPDAISFDTELHFSHKPDPEVVQKLSNFTQVTLKRETISATGESYETGGVQYALALNQSLTELDFDQRFGEYFDEDLVRPINVEQKFFYTIVTHPQNSVTVAAGSTGSGKTLIALQAGLELVKDGIVEGIIYARNTITSNDQHAELGFRKGDEHEKLGYFMYPLYSAINFTIEQMKSHSLDPHVEFSGNTNSVKKENATASFMAKYNIEVMDIAHLRGTTISKKFVIIDETQNMTNATLKLIGTRMGEGTKLVLLGDPHQIDHPFLSKRRNALVSLLKKAEVDDYIAGVQLRHTIRSQTADWFDKNF